MNDDGDERNESKKKTEKTLEEEGVVVENGRGLSGLKRRREKRKRERNERSKKKRKTNDMASTEFAAVTQRIIPWLFLVSSCG